MRLPVDLSPLRPFLTEVDTWIQRRRGRYAFKNGVHVRLVGYLRSRDVRLARPVPEHLAELDDPRVLRALRRAVLERRAMQERTTAMLGWLSAVVALLGLASTVTGLAHLHVEFVFGLLALVPFMVCLLVPLYLVERLRPRAGLAMLSSVLLTGMAVGWLISRAAGATGTAGQQLADRPSDLQRQFGVIVLYLSGWILLSLVAIFLLAVVTDAVLRRLEARSAVAVAVDDLLIVLAYARDPSTYLQAGQQLSLRALENAAGLLRADLSSPPAGDGPTSHWAKKQARNVAWNIRYLKRWVIAPTSRTDRRLIRQVELALVALASGRIGDLTQVEQEFPPDRGRLSGLLAGVRTIAVGCLPLAVAAVLGRRGALPPDVRGPVYLVTSLLAVVAVLAVLDPSFRDRISTAKDLYGFLDPRKGDDRATGP